jgi:hypothetical protein
MVGVPKLYSAFSPIAKLLSPALVEIAFSPIAVLCLADGALPPSAPHPIAVLFSPRWNSAPCRLNVPSVVFPLASLTVVPFN